MTATLIKTSIVFTIYMFTAPFLTAIASFVASVIFSFYIIHMFYFNVIKKHFNGNWKAYLKAILSWIKSLSKR